MIPVDRWTSLRRSAVASPERRLANGFCAAVDHTGNAVTYNGKTWTTPHSVDPHSEFLAVACASATFYVATGGHVRGIGGVASAAMYNGTTWMSLTGSTASS